MDVVVVSTLKHRIEIWCVIHGRKLIHTFMSQTQAERAAARLRMRLQRDLINGTI